MLVPSTLKFCTAKRITKNMRTVRTMVSMTSRSRRKRFSKSNSGLMQIPPDVIEMTVATPLVGVPCVHMRIHAEVQGRDTHKGCRYWIEFVHHSTIIRLIFKKGCTSIQSS